MSEVVFKAPAFGWYTGARPHLCHLSLTRSARLVRRCVANGLDVSTVTCAHYMVFCEPDLAARGGWLKIKPPLCSPQEREGSWALLAEGAFTVISSDDALWVLADKSHPNVFDNQSGVPGVETQASLISSEALRRGWGLVHAAWLLATNPARRFALASKGVFAVGADADVIVFDPGAGQTLGETGLHPNAGWQAVAKCSTVSRSGRQRPGR